MTGQGAGTLSVDVIRSVSDTLTKISKQQTAAKAEPGEALVGGRHATHAHMITHTHTCTSTCEQHTHTRAHSLKGTRTPSQTCSFTFTRTFPTCVGAHKHTHTNTHTLTHTRTHTHTHVHTSPQLHLLPPRSLPKRPNSACAVFTLP